MSERLREIMEGYEHQLKHIANVPLWCWGITAEDLSDLERQEITFKEEEDLLTSFDFLFGEY